MDTPQNSPAPDAVAPKTSYGAVVGLLIVVAAIVMGALYFLQERVATELNMGDTSDFAAQGTSTDPQDIEADLEAQSSDDFDKEIDEAFVEMEAAL